MPNNFHDHEWCINSLYSITPAQDHSNIRSLKGLSRHAPPPITAQHSKSCNKTVYSLPQYLHHIWQAVSEDFHYLAHSPSIQVYQVSSVQWGNFQIGLGKVETGVWSMFLIFLWSMVWHGRCFLFSFCHFLCTSLLTTSHWSLPRIGVQTNVGAWKKQKEVCVCTGTCVDHSWARSCCLCGVNT